MRPYVIDRVSIKDENVPLADHAFVVIDRRGPRFIGGLVCTIWPKGTKDGQTDGEDVAQRIIDLLNDDFEKNGTPPFPSVMT